MNARADCLHQGQLGHADSHGTAPVTGSAAFKSATSEKGLENLCLTRCVTAPADIIAIRMTPQEGC